MNGRGFLRFIGLALLGLPLAIPSLSKHPLFLQEGIFGEAVLGGVAADDLHKIRANTIATAQNTLPELAPRVAQEFVVKLDPASLDTLKTLQATLEQTSFVCDREIAACEDTKETSEMDDVKKPVLRALVRDDPKTPEGKYLVKRRDGSVVEWPHFVLGARDPHAPAALRAYAWSASQDPNFDQSLIYRLRSLADEFEIYRTHHGAGDPHLGIHRKDDPNTVAEMRKKGRSS